MRVSQKHKTEPFFVVMQGYIFRFLIISPPPSPGTHFFSPTRKTAPAGSLARLAARGVQGGAMAPPRKFFEISTWKDAFLRLLKEF